MSFNKVFILGNAGRDPEVRHLEGGAAVANFTVATSEVFRDRNGNRQERTEWHNIVCWRQLAEFAEKYVKKGTQVFIEGKIRTRDYTDQSGQKRYVTEIFADNLQLVGRKSDNPANSAGGYQAPAQGGYQAPAQPTQVQRPQPAAPQAQETADFPSMDDFNDTDANDLPF